MDEDRRHDIVIRMKYVALLRGINVGGNSLIKMDALKAAFEKTGHTNVRTLIASGNVIFDSDEKNQEKLAKTLEEAVMKTFNVSSRVLVLSEKEMKTVLAEIPASWKKVNDLRMYVCFIFPTMKPKDAAHEVPVKDGIDVVDVGKNVLYLSTKMQGITKSGLSKMVGTKMYKEMTMRNFNTTKRIVEMMEKN